MNFKSFQELIRSDIKQFGFAKMLYDLLLRAVNRVVFVKILKGIYVDRVNPKCLEADKSYQWQFFDAAQLQMLAENPDHDMSAAFLRSAIEKGDQCYGALDGQILASYGWYSDKPTETSDDLTAHHSAEYIYMYKGFTHPNYRGQRLHAIGMNRALREYLDRDYLGLVSYIESNNFSSLKSAYRLGFRDFGWVFVLKIGRHPLVHASQGCRKFGFFFKRTSSGISSSNSLDTDGRPARPELRIADSLESSSHTLAEVGSKTCDGK